MSDVANNQGRDKPKEDRAECNHFCELDTAFDQTLTILCHVDKVIILLTENK